MKVNNVSENALRNPDKYPWMVVRFVDGEFWYYGAWRKLEDAAQIAVAVNGAVVPSNMVKEGLA